MARRFLRALTALGLTLSVTATGLAVSTTPAAAQGSITIEGGGWGHGVGMSQYGAHGQAQAGRNYRQILQHYYQGVTLGTAGPWNDVRALIGEGPGSVELKPRGSTTLYVSRPGQSTVDRAIGANHVLRIDVSGGALRVRHNGSDIPGSPFASGSRARLVVPTARVEVKPAARSQFLGWGSSEATRDYRYGQVEVSTGVSGCAGGSLCTVVRNMNMQQYLYGVAEMPGSWHGEALKAQALAARSFAARRVALPRIAGLYHLRADVFDQVFRGWSYQS